MAGEKSFPDAETLVEKLQALRPRLADRAGDLPELEEALTDLLAAAEELGAADEAIRSRAEKAAESRREAEDQRRRYPNQGANPMHAYVDDNCTACGLCEDTCPAVFQLGERDIAEVVADPIPPEHEAAAQEAADGCPVDAIHIEK